MQRKNKVRGIVIMIILAIFILAVCVGIVSYMKSKAAKRQVFSYEEDQETLENPARGFYTQIYYTDAERLKGIREWGQTLALVTMTLSDFKETEISESELEKLRGLLEEARKQEVMIIFRASYIWEDSGPEPELSTINTHIVQLAEVLNEYKDVVLVVQTGMVGLWGEWHGSIYLEDEEALHTEAIRVVKWWQEELDGMINLNLRRPLFIVAAQEEGCDMDRLGMHNDALLATDSDMGTYLDREEELQWCEENLNGKVNGGEMPYVSEYTELPTVLKEFGQLSITYLNANYNIAVLEEWEKQSINGENALSYIEKKLGYRYFADELTVNKKLYAYTKTLDIDLCLKNSGFSSIQDRFHLYLVLDDGTEKRFLRLENQGTGKEEERYSYSVGIDEVKPIKIGFCYMDASGMEYEAIPENSHTVEFANDEMVYENGINYYISYEFEEGNEKVCVPQELR